MSEPSGITRRGALQIGGATALATLLRPDPIADAADPAPPPSTNPVTSGPLLAKPYKLTHTSQLSQDIYKTSDVLLDQDDHVHPFHDAQGNAGALVLQGTASTRVLSVAWPDPSTPGGWSLTALTVPSPTLSGSNLRPSQYTVGTPSHVTVARHSDGKVYALIAIPYTVQKPEDMLGGMFATTMLCAELQRQTGSRWQLRPVTEIWRDPGFTLPPNDPRYRFQQGLPAVPPRFRVDSSGTLRFYFFTGDNDYVVLSMETKRPYARRLRAGAIQGLAQGLVLPGQAFDWVAGISRDGTLVVAEGRADRKGSAWSLITLQDGKLLELGAINAVSGLHPALLFWDAQDPSDRNYNATSALFLLDLTDLGPGLSQPELNALTTPLVRYRQFDSAAVLAAGGLWKLASTAKATSGEHVLSTFSQTGKLDQSRADWVKAFAGPLPFQSGADRVWTDPTPNAPGNVLFFRNAADQTLRVLMQPLPSATTLKPAGTPWTTATVELPGDVAQDLTHWRTHLVVRDARNVPVPDYTLQIEASELVSLWQTGGHTVVGPGRPGKFTTNGLGQVVIGTPAEQLSTPELRVSGDGLDDLVVRPDGEVHAYLAGTGTIASRSGAAASGKLTGDALLAARDAAGRPLAPGLGSTSSDTARKSAGAVVKMVNQCAKAGLDSAAGKKPAKGDVTSFSFDATGSIPIYSDNTQPGYNPPSFAASTPLPRTEFAAFAAFSWSDISDLADEVADGIESAAHAVEHAVIKVAKATFEYSEKTGEWAGKLAVTFADGLKATFEFVISDLRSALAAVAGVLKTIGAELEKVIEYLRALFGGILLRAIRLAEDLAHAVNLIPQRFADGVQPIARTIAEGVRTGAKALEAQLEWLAERIDGKGGELTLKSFHDRSVAFPGGSTQSAGDAFHFITSDVQASWLLNKLLDLFEPENLTSTKVAAAVVAAEEALADDAAQLVVELGNDLTNAFQALIDDGDPESLLEAELVALLQAVGDVMTTGIDVIAGAPEEILNLIDAALSDAIEVALGAGAGGILDFVNDVLELLGLSFKATYLNVFCLALAIPSVMLASDEAPARGVASAASASEADKALEIAGVVATAVYSSLDVVKDLKEALESGGAEVEEGGSGEVFLEFVDLLSFAASGAALAVDFPGDEQYEPISDAPYKLSGESLLDYWLGGCLPLALQGIELFRPLQPEVSQFLYCAAGSALTAAGTYITATTDPFPGAYAMTEAVIGWLPAALEPLANGKVNEGLRSVPLILKVVLDGGIGVSELVVGVAALSTE